MRCPVPRYDKDKEREERCSWMILSHNGDVNAKGGGAGGNRVHLDDGYGHGATAPAVVCDEAGLPGRLRKMKSRLVFENGIRLAKFPGRPGVTGYKRRTRRCMDSGICLDAWRVSTYI